MQAYNPIQIVLVDDHTLFREAIATILSQSNGLNIVGEASTAVEAERIIRTKKPHVVVLDIGLGSGSGLDLAEKLAAEGVDQKFIILTGNEEPTYFERARENPRVVGYILKLDALDKLETAIRNAFGSERMVSDRIANALAWRTSDNHAGEVLTARERQVLAMVGDGLSSEQIAHRIKLSRRTIDSHRARIKAKLGLMNAADFARYAIDKRLI